MVCISTIHSHAIRNEEGFCHFQYIINHVIGGLEDDEVYSDDWEQHVKQLCELLCHLRTSKLTVNLRILSCLC